MEKIKKEPSLSDFRRYCIIFAETINTRYMTITDYLLIPLILFVALLYPLLRKALALGEVFVTRYVKNSGTATRPQENPTATTLLNLKLLACERVLLFVERMKPDSLIPRTLTPALTVKEYQSLLTGEIRKEYEYNLSQQLYVSENTWSVTSNFKDSIITLINSAAADCEPDKPAGELAKKVLERYIGSEIRADQVIRIIKSDIQ